MARNKEFWNSHAPMTEINANVRELAGDGTPINYTVFAGGMIDLKLKGCDEKTAAMIMAIVSDNTGIPLSELVFKSITLVENK